MRVGSGLDTFVLMSPSSRYKVILGADSVTARKKVFPIDVDAYRSSGCRSATERLLWRLASRRLLEARIAYIRLRLIASLILRGWHIG